MKKVTELRAAQIENVAWRKLIHAMYNPFEKNPPRGLYQVDAFIKRTIRELREV